MSDVAFQMIFSPQNCTLDLLEATLTQHRRGLAQHIIERAEDACRKGSACHHLVVGPRGAGKTHVFSYVRKRLEQLCADTQTLQVIPLSEEERSITRLFDFLVACIRALGLPLPETMARLRSVPRAQATTEAVMIFEQAVAGKSPLILVENFDRILGTMNNAAVGELRAFFQTHSHVSILASATSLFEDSTQPDHPFYGFFLIEPLQPLNAEGAREFLGLLAQSAGEADLAALLRRPQSQSRVNAVFDLTGGNHRLLAMLSTFLTVEGLHDLVGPFVHMVDRELTPYYQQRLDRLSAQQNQILRAIVDIPSMHGPQGRAVSLSEIVDYSFLTSQHCSRLMYDLKYTGLIRTQKKGRESLYELNEPLLRLVLDVKEGRNRPLLLVVNLLKLWYKSEELTGLAEKAPEGIREYYQEAQRDIESKSGQETQYQIEPKGKKDFDAQTEEIQALIDKGVELGCVGEHDKALVLFEQVLDLTTDNPEHSAITARALFNKGAMLGQLGRSEEAITVYDTLVERFGDRQESSLLQPVAQALYKKGVILRRLDRPKEAIMVCDTVAERFAESPDGQIRQQVVTALAFAAHCLVSLSKESEALERSHKAIEMAPEDPFAVGIHVVVLLRNHQTEAALSNLESGLDRIPRDHDQASLLVAPVLSECSKNRDVLARVLQILKKDESILAGGLITWIKSLLPMSKAEAEGLEVCQAVLKETLADVSQCQPLVQILEAVRGEVLGDKHALLNLPLELRRLIRPEV